MNKLLPLLFLILNNNNNKNKNSEECEKEILCSDCLEDLCLTGVMIIEIVEIERDDDCEGD